MRRLFARQLAKATSASGEVDIDALARLVIAAYEEADRDRCRTDRSISLMIEELDQLTRGLEEQVRERTAALQEREAQLQAQNLLIDGALKHISQALVMFDADARLVVSNHKYDQMFKLDPEAVRPGVSLQELLELRKKVGTLAEDPEQLSKQIRKTIGAGKEFSRLAELPDGRTIAVAGRPIPGGGWVVTHEDITERRQAEQQIAHLARHDFLTDLPNRMLLRERLTQGLAEMRRGGRLAVLCLDIDRFKNVNDTLGHRLGDDLLQIIADRLRGCVRDGDTVARLGGDEFAIVQTGVRQPRDMANLASRIGEALREPCQLGDHSVLVDASIGIAVAPFDGDDPDELLKNADMALYGAKRHGGGSYCFFEPIMDARMRERRELETALRSSLAAEHFELYYQPMLALENDKVIGFEALIRWHHPERGMISPAAFVPVAEEIGLIVPMGEWVLRQALADAARWPDDTRVAVNLSPTQVMHPNLVATVVEALKDTGIPANRLEIEITESVLMQNAETTVAALHRLRELGVRISLDDFGTGYSSLSYLRRFPFDKIKIDRSFIAGLSEGEDSAAIVRAVVNLAGELNIITTAEGIETPEQLRQVRALGCSEAQGYLFSKPQPVGNLSPFLTSPYTLRSIHAA